MRVPRRLPIVISFALGMSAAPARTEVPVDVAGMRAMLVRVSDVWRYACGATDLPVGWNDRGFDSSSWCSGPTPIGFGEEPDEMATQVPDLFGSRISLALLRAFRVEGPPGSEPIALAIDYDDGFIAWVNGREVARRGLPDGVVDPTTPAQNHESGTPEVISLGLASDLLVEGWNVLALEIHNSSLQSEDLLIAPALLVASRVAKEGDLWIVDGATARVGGTLPWSISGARSVRVQGLPARYDWFTRSWTAEVPLDPGLQALTVEVLDAGLEVIDSTLVEILRVLPVDATFSRGDANADGETDIADAVRILYHLFAEGDPLSCEKSADVDDDGLVNITDPIRLLGFLFLGQEPPAVPFPGCAADPTPDRLGCEQSAVTILNGSAVRMSIP